MSSDYFPARAKWAISIAGLTAALCGLAVIILFLAGGPMDLRPRGLKLYVEDLRNPSIIFITGWLIYFALHPTAWSGARRRLKSLAGYILAPSSIPIPSLDSAGPIRAHAMAFSVLLLLSILAPYKIYLAPDSSWPIAEPIRYLSLGAYFRESINAGHLYPRWLPDLYFGYGYPTFIFYPAGYFFLSAAVGSMTEFIGGVLSTPISIILTEWMTLSLVLFIGGMGAYFLCSLFAGAHLGLACALIFLISPYTLANLQFRNDYSELLSMMLAPYVFYFFLRMAVELKAGSRKCLLHSALFGVFLFMAFISHPAIALFLATAAFLYGTGVILFTCMDRPSLASASLLFFSGFALGLALSSPYWLHALHLKSQVYLTAATGHNHDVNRWIAQPEDFFRRDPSGGNFYQLGLPNFLLALIGVIIGRKDPRIWMAFILYAGAVLALTRLGHGLWSYFDLVRYVQFPWRSQAILAVLQIICAGGAAAALSANGKGRAVFGYLVVVACALWYAGSFSAPAKNPPRFYQPELNELIRSRVDDPDPRKNTFSDKVEFAPLASLNLTGALSMRMKQLPRPAELIQAERGEAVIAPIEDSSTYRIHYRVIAPGGAGLRINQAYFPGWKVWVDGAALGDGELSANAQDEGIIKFSVAPGEREVLAYYEGPPYWRERNLAIITVIALFIGSLALVNFRYLRPAR